MTCKADGSPTPNLSWKNPSGKVVKNVTELTNTVDVPMSSDQDFGTYTCEATNDVNTDTSTVLVQQISKWNISCSLVVNIYDIHTSGIRNDSILLSFCRLRNGCVNFFHLKYSFRGVALTVALDQNALLESMSCGGPRKTPL